MRRALALVLLLCGCTPAVNFTCQGNSCTCTDGLTCNESPCDTTTSSCAFTCSTGSACVGTCGDTCQIICNGSMCQFTAGPNSSLTCNEGTCRFTCNGPCAVTGSAQVTCQGSTVDTTGSGCH